MTRAARPKQLLPRPAPGGQRWFGMPFNWNTRQWRGWWSRPPLLSGAVCRREASPYSFGIDSLIELASAGVLIWRLTIELRHGQALAEGAEQMASRVAGGLLFALAAYVVAAAAWKLSTRTGQAFSWPGLIVTVLAMPVMYFLARQKIAVAEALGSHAMRADAMESVTCGWLSLVVVIGLVAEGVTGAWWVDAVTSLGIVWFLIKEGREAWSGDACCCD